MITMAILRVGSSIDVIVRTIAMVICVVVATATQTLF